MGHPQLSAVYSVESVEGRAVLPTASHNRVFRVQVKDLPAPMVRILAIPFGNSAYAAHMRTHTEVHANESIQCRRGCLLRFQRPSATDNPNLLPTPITALCSPQT